MGLAQAIWWITRKPFAPSLLFAVKQRISSCHNDQNVSSGSGIAYARSPTIMRLSIAHWLLGEIQDAITQS